MDIEILKIPIEDITLPVAAAAEMSKLAVALKVFCGWIYQEYKSENNSPPQSLLPWIKEYRHTLKDVYDMVASSTEAADKKAQSVKVFIDVYNTIQSELPTDAKIEVARIAAKKAKEIDANELIPVT